jgi:predicted kinase
MAEFELGHKEIMEANNLTQSDLPKEIEAKILSLTMLMSSYESTPSEELKEKIEHQSAKIGHDILDYLEKDLPSEPVSVQGDNQSQQNNQQQGNDSQQSSPSPQSKEKEQSNTEKRSGNGLFNFLGF